MLGIKEKPPPRPGSFLQGSTEIFSHVLVLFCQVKGPKRHKKGCKSFLLSRKDSRAQGTFQGPSYKHQPKGQGQDAR